MRIVKLVEVSRAARLQSHDGLASGSVEEGVFIIVRLSFCGYHSATFVTVAALYSKGG